MNELIITQATKEDLPAILDVQKKAFLEVVRAFHVKSLPPLEQTLDSVTDEFNTGTILKATLTSAADMKDRQNIMASLRRVPFRVGSETTEAISSDTGIAALLSGARNDKLIVGSVRAYQENDTCYIGKLVVLPEYQNEGIGKALMRAIEDQYKNIVKRYELFTGTRDPKNRRLYSQLGYKSFKTEKLNDDVSFVYMEKYLE